MEPQGHAPKTQSDWLQAELRIWCVGGWWFQVPGHPRQRLDGNDAASALLRHLAVRAGGGTPKSELQRWLSRTPNGKITVESLNTAVSRVRGVLRDAIGPGEEAEKLVNELLPRAKTGQSADGSSAEAIYRLGDAVWTDLRHAASASLGARLLGPAYQVSATAERGVKGKLQGQEELRREVEERRARKQATLSKEDFDPHLRNLTPPISHLSALVPQALDRLRQGRMLSIIAEADSGRMHLAEAVELGARVYCGRSTEQIREQPRGGAPADDPDLRAQQPGHLCVVDLTRPISDEQIERLRAVSEGDGEPPALLLVREGPLPPPLSFLGQRWGEEEPLQLPTPSRKDVLEAYLIGTEGSGTVERRRSQFSRLWKEYESHHKAPPGLRAAASAATTAAEHGAPPPAKELPGPPSLDFDFIELEERPRYLAQCLAWFGNRPFDLLEAKEASGYEDLEEREVFDIATQIPGGRKVFELRPQLLAAAEPPAEAHRRICEYLISRDEVEPIVERWPGRALRILDKDSVPIEHRLDLAVLLFGTCRDQGLAKSLAQAMEKLREKAGELGERLARFEIERARLLTHLDDFEEADAILGEVTAVRRRTGDWPALKARAHLRRAIAASRLGDTKRARREAQKAERHSALQVKVESFYGWEATHTAQFEEAISRFERALSLDGDDEERADAVIGMSRDLIRLGRAREAEEAVATLEGLDLHRHTRDRIARVNASLCHLRGELSSAIDDYIDPALLSASSNYSSASALLLEASAFLHLEAGEVNAADEDIKRSLSVLENSGGKPSSATHYVRALIYEAEAEAARKQGTADLLLECAREEAELCVQTGIERNEWALARAHTLRGRLALRAEDWTSLARCLGAAVAAHRKLDLRCPAVLVQTLELGAKAAATWQMGPPEERLRELIRLLNLREPSPSVRLADALAAATVVLERVEAGPPSVPPTLDSGGLKDLGRVGEAIVAGFAAAQNRSRALQLQILVPRPSNGLGEGLYEISPGTNALLRYPELPARAVDLLAEDSERRLVQRHAASVLVVSSYEGDSRGAYLALGEWLAAFKSIARERGVAVLEPISVQTGFLEAMEETPPQAILALALAEMPVLA
jgi:tetratricopeptide (TPR) repeat protein